MENKKKSHLIMVYNLVGLDLNGTFINILNNKVIISLGTVPRILIILAPLRILRNQVVIDLYARYMIRQGILLHLVSTYVMRCKKKVHSLGFHLLRSMSSKVTLILILQISMPGSLYLDMQCTQYIHCVRTKKISLQQNTI